MKLNTVVASLAAISCGLAITLVSCNGDNDLNAPTNPSRGGKAPEVLSDNCNATKALNRCAMGSAVLEYNQEFGDLTATNLNDLRSGISSVFAPTRNWQQAVDADIPEQDGQQITAVAYNQGNVESDLRVGRGSNPSLLQLTPTFLAGDGIYNVEVYNQGQLVATQPNVPPTSPPTAAARGKFWRWVKFHVRFGPASLQRQKGNSLSAKGETGACEWVVSDDLGPSTSITLPDGRVVQGNEIRFTEVVDGSGRYPYHTTDRIDVLTNIGTYTVLAEYAGS